ncbi:MAG: type II toxin-antitoxin system VapC family toxin [Planctomycetes bacterium]|nr:type II toxin-antitoxin system VapC family toxin [Planctomycetota bacterium]
MKFWDSSGLVALHVAQTRASRLRSLHAGDPQVLAWQLSDVEVRSALCRLERDGAMTRDAFLDAVSRFESFWGTVHVISSVDPVKARAKRLLGIHPLRAADALQLAAALVAASDDPQGWEFVCLDGRLADAAVREGFSVRP